MNQSTQVHLKASDKIDHAVHTFGGSTNHPYLALSICDHTKNPGYITIDIYIRDRHQLETLINHLNAAAVEWDNAREAPRHRDRHTGSGAA